MTTPRFEAVQTPSADVLADASQVGLMPRFSIEEIRDQSINTHGFAIEQPTDQIVGALHADDPRIAAIRGVETLRGQPILPHIGGPGLTPTQWYSYLMAPSMTAALEKDFPGQHLKIRSIQASLDGPVIGSDTYVGDLRQILHEGDITERDVVNLDDFDPANEAELFSSIGERVLQYAAKTGGFRQGLGRADGVGRIFPVLLVYDESRVTHLRGYKHETLATDRSSLIRKAYVLDALVRA